MAAKNTIGASLKQRVGAEGIDTRQQLDFRRSRHCAKEQGYLYSRPVAAKEFATKSRHTKASLANRNGRGGLRRDRDWRMNLVIEGPAIVSYPCQT
jgi:predicted signal transduction protein with EAL and GGDEF domain